MILLDCVGSLVPRLRKQNSTGVCSTQAEAFLLVLFWLPIAIVRVFNYAVHWRLVNITRPTQALPRQITGKAKMKTRKPTYCVWRTGKKSDESFKYLLDARRFFQRMANVRSTLGLFVVGQCSLPLVDH